MELDRSAELDLGARMVNAARMAVAAHLFESVRERVRLREGAVIDAANTEGQDDPIADSEQHDNVNDSLWQRPPTGGAGFRAAGTDDGQPAFASARRVALVTDDDDEGGSDGSANATASADDVRAAARPLPTVTARSPRTPRLPDAGGAPPHAGGARPRPAGFIGIGCGCVADRVRPCTEAGAVAWAEGAD